MIKEILEWLFSNKIELLGAILGILYIFLAIKQNILTWPTGLLTSALYVVVFFQAKLYADMGLQFYYVLVSFYGWYYWLKGKNTDKNKNVPVRLISKKLLLLLSIISIILYFVILTVLLNYTDSDVPYMDSLTTALSIVATWMLAKKYIEHWLIWVFVDLFSAGLYVYKGMWPTVVLFIVYTILAVQGYRKWKSDLSKHFINEKT